MANAHQLVEVWRGDFLESQHRGHAMVMDSSGHILACWGDPDAVILPRSSVKMLQALPLIESGAAKAADLQDEQLALSCASHQGASIHVTKTSDWLSSLGLDESDLRCGSQVPNDLSEKKRILCSEEKPCQLHNNCSGKHVGFLTLNKHLGGGSEYNDVDHPVQKAIKQAFEEITENHTLGYGIDGCSAPNFASTLTGLTRAMASMADPSALGETRANAAKALVGAMQRYPVLVAGEGRACTELMQAMDGKVAVKTGAEGVFIAIVPEKRVGVALKIEDGATRAAECAIAAILVRLGVLSPDHPLTIKRLNPRILNRREIDTGQIRPSAMFYKNGAKLG